jgi:hypothetical protein
MAPKSEKEERSQDPEEIEIAGNEPAERVKALIREGNVRRLIIRKENNETLLEIPLTAGVAVGSVLTIFAPVLAAVGAMAALLAKVKVEIVRTSREEKKA